VRCDDYQRSVLKEAIDLPMIQSIIYPVIIIVQNEGVKKFEILKVKSDILFRPIEKLIN